MNGRRVKLYKETPAAGAGACRAGCSLCRMKPTLDAGAHNTEPVAPTILLAMVEEPLFELHLCVVLKSAM